MRKPVAVDARGNELLRFAPGVESDLEHLDPGIALPLSLVVAHKDVGTLLVFNRWRQEWELPGGMIDAGESPREAAVREFVEETAQPAPELDFAGVATFRLLPDHRLEYAAVYGAEIVHAASPFEANAEIEDIRWWDGAALPGIAELDAEIGRLVAPTPIVTHQSRR